MKKKQPKKFTITYYDEFGGIEKHETDNINSAIRQIRKAEKDNYYDLRDVHIDMFIPREKTKDRLYNSRTHFERNIKQETDSIICDENGYITFKYICKKLGWWK